jgi:hypothetical protein
MVDSETVNRVPEDWPISGINNTPFEAHITMLGITDTYRMTPNLYTDRPMKSTSVTFAS